MITSIATGVAVLTVLVSALAVRAEDDPFSYAGSRFPGWLMVLGLTLVGFVVGSLWATGTPGGIRRPGNGRLAQPVEHSIADIPRSSGRRA